MPCFERQGPSVSPATFRHPVLVTDSTESDASATLPESAPSVSAAARMGDRSALARLGSIGGKRRAERARQRRVAEAETVLLRTAQAMREFLERRAGEVEASREAASTKASAAARLVGALTELDGLTQLARENACMRAELAAFRSGMSGGIDLSRLSDAALAELDAAAIESPSVPGVEPAGTDHKE